MHNKLGYLRIVTIRLIALVTLTAPLGFVVGCQAQKGRSEAAILLINLNDLRKYPNEMKRDPLEKLKSTPCTDTEVCAAKEACSQAFEHHVRSVELGQSLKKTLDSNPSPSPDDHDALRARLLETNIEVEEGRKAMPLCESRIVELRLKYKL